MSVDPATVKINAPSTRLRGASMRVRKNAASIKESTDMSA